MYAELEQKVCPKCKEVKNNKDFYARSDRKCGKMSMCKLCHSLWQKARRALDPGKWKTYEFARGLKRHYGLSVEQYNQILSDQGGVCGSCGNDGKEFKNGFHVDHDKHTGQVRGILCNRCNPGLGYFEHKIEKLEMAIAYLKKFKK